jgi:hypothetical protein
MSNPFPLTLPPDLLEQIRRIAKQTKLSMADVMRQSIRFGAPLMARWLSNDDEMTAVIAGSWDKLGPAPTVNYGELRRTRTGLAHDAAGV